LLTHTTEQVGYLEGCVSHKIDAGGDAGAYQFRRAKKRQSLDEVGMAGEHDVAQLAVRSGVAPAV